MKPGEPDDGSGAKEPSMSVCVKLRACLRFGNLSVKERDYVHQNKGNRIRGFEAGSCHISPVPGHSS